MSYNLRILIIISVVIGVYSCEKDELTSLSSAKIEFSSDTVTFDTVFTEVGSVTRIFKVYNNNNKSIKISSVYLKNGASSNYRINVDGILAEQHREIIIRPGDSLFVFVEVTLDPVNDNLPLLVTDAIVFNSNNNTYEVILEAFGQDVHLYNNKIIESETWIDDKPYLVYGNLTVDEGHTLTIKEGVRVHLHNNSSIVVLGNIVVDGTFDKRVVFDGDRLDYGYDKTAGRWGTIYLDQISTGNTIKYAIVKNAVAGFQVGAPNDENEIASVDLQNVLIQNCSGIGIIAYGSEINAYNTIVADAQFHGFVAQNGGKYNFYHCTFSVLGAFYIIDGQFENYTRSGDGYCIALLNKYTPFYYNELDEYFKPIRKNYYNDLTEANFYNSIFYGSNDDELLFNFSEEADSNLYFDHCIITQSEEAIDTSDGSRYNEIILNKDPLFMNDSIINADYDFRLDSLSPAINKGSMEVINQNPILQYDFEGNLRTEDGIPDLGAFERLN